MSMRKPITTASLLALVTAFGSVAISTPKLHAAVPQYTIMQVQGSGTRSPVEGQTVTTTGVVYDVTSKGFWMQDTNGDGNPATSDGIYVVTPSVPTVQKGDLISVTGAVAESAAPNDEAAAPQTQITGPTISVISSGNPLPAPVTITATDINPAGSISQLEKYEGMRVHVDALNVISPTGGALNESMATSTSDGAFYGVLPGLPRAFRGAGIEQPAAAPMFSPCCIPFWNGAPQRIRVDTKTLSSPVDVGTGAIVADLTGPLNFSAHTYTIVTETTPTVVTPSPSSATALSAPTSGEFTIATFALQRFFDTTDDPGNDVALTTSAFNGRLNKASLAIRNLLNTPDVIAVQEVEKLSTLQALANKINTDAVAAGSATPGYTAYLIPGNDPVSNVGFLVRPRVTVNSVNQYGKDEMYQQPDGNIAFVNDRPPLVLDASVTNEHETGRFIVINVHNIPPSGSDNFVDGSRVRLKRKLQAEYLANLAQSFQAADANAKIIVLGEVNSFAVNDGYVDVLGTVLGTPTAATQVVAASVDLVDPNFTNLETLLPAEQRYSVLDKGTAESLDYILASQGMLTVAGRVAIERSNVDFPESYRGDFSRPERISTHDMVVGYFNLPIDRTPPVLTLPSDMTVEATSTSGAVVTFTATAQDTNDGVVNVTCKPASGDTFPLGTTAVSCSAQDARQNIATGTFNVRVTDTTPPKLTLPADFAAEATGNSGAVVNFTASAQDIADGAVSVQCNPASGSTFALGPTAVSCSATDAHNNSASGSFQVTVVDTTAPLLDLPADINASATSSAGSTVNYSASATDAVDGTVAVLCNPASGETFALGTTTVSCTTQDAHHNISNGSFRINVSDTTPPVLTLPSDINVSATSASGTVVTFTASALDAVDGTVAVTCSPSSGSMFVTGTTTVSCTTQDAAHNIASGSFSVSVTDTTPPVLTLPADLSTNATSAAGAVVTFSASAIDNVDGAVAANCTPASGSTFPIGTTTVSCSAQDAHHNVATGDIHVTVSDTTPPVLTLPADISVQATSTSGAIVNYTATAKDVVDGAVAVLCSPTSGSTFPIGTTSVSCTAQDGHHNAANGQFRVIVSAPATPPLVKVTGVVDGTNYLLGSVPAAGCSTTVTSAPVATNASLNLTGGTANGVGTFTATCSGAKDVIGNVTPPVTATYTVTYMWSGFIGLNSSLSQAGSTIPMKWVLLNSRGEIAGNLSSVRSLNAAANVDCNGQPEGAPFPAQTPGDNTLSFGNGVFQFNWKTTGLTGGCYSILLGLDDGSTRTAIVVLKSNDDLAKANARPGRSDHNGQIDSAKDNRRAWSVVERWDEHKQKLELRLVSKTRKK